MNILVYQHIYKNGGSTVWKRYKNNAVSTLLRFPSYELPTKCIRTKDDEEYDTPFNNKMNPQPQFIHGRLHPGLLENNFDCNPIYTTTLREPIDRIMSAYNFFISDIWYKWGNEMDVDFKLWFLNSFNLVPTEYEAQYEWFILHTNENPISYNDALVSTYKRFKFREWQRHEERESIPTEERAIALEEKNCELAFNNIKKRYKHVFFLDQVDRLEKIDKLFQDYDIPVNPNVNITNENDSNDAFGPMKRNAVQFTDLSTEYQEFAYKFLKYEIQFYNNCKDEYS
jgi:hypothetical protein